MKWHKVTFTFTKI